MDRDTLVFNGVDGRDGSYLLPPLQASQLARVALGQRLPTTDLDEFQLKLGQDFDYPLREGVDPDDLAESGWAVVFPFVRKGSEAARRQVVIRESLAPLLAHRRSQAGYRDERYYRDCVGPNAYRPGETKQQFLARMGAGSGPVDPSRFPYYLLLVASPEEIPYRVQYQLDVQYAVGRIHFDTADEYAHYAASVVAAETNAPPRAHTVAFFGVANPDDRATQASARHLVAPLADYVSNDLSPAAWQVERFVGDAATKACLSTLLGDEVPAFLFTASHGVGFPNGDPRQRRAQGALLCQDWGGPRTAVLSPDHYLSGDDIAAATDLRGLIGFHFACFGAGTPKHDDFVRQTLGQVAPVDIAPQSFLARLPQRLLGKPRGAAAYIGHVDRAWGSSFLQHAPHVSNATTPQLAVFESTVRRLLEGHRVGYAMDYFDIRYAEMASDLANRIEEIQRYDEDCDDDELASLWVYSSDARNYAVIGDPAVRLQTEPLRRLRETHTKPQTISLHSAVPTRSPPTQLDGSGANHRTSDYQAGDCHTSIPDTIDASAALPRPAHTPPTTTTKALPATTLELIREMVATVCRNAATLPAFDLRTYSDVNLADLANTDTDPSSMPTPRAFTRTTADGATTVSVPRDSNGAVDVALWRAHHDAVIQAQTHHRELLTLLLSLLPARDA